MINRSKESLLATGLSNFFSTLRLSLFHKYIFQKKIFHIFWYLRYSRKLVNVKYFLGQKITPTFKENDSLFKKEEVIFWIWISLLTPLNFLCINLYLPLFFNIATKQWKIIYFLEKNFLLEIFLYISIIFHGTNRAHCWNKQIAQVH